jgi:hypothetical protein
MRRLAMVAALGLSASGCMAWRVDQVSPRELLSDRSIDAVRVTRADKSKVEIWNPSIQGDSIIGHPTNRAIARLVMPLSQVTSIATRHQSVGRTLLITGAIIAGIGVYALLQSLNQGT